jgi:hypothetical protein
MEFNTLKDDEFTNNNVKLENETINMIKKKSDNEKLILIMLNFYFIMSIPMFISFILGFIIYELCSFKYFLISIVVIWFLPFTYLFILFGWYIINHLYWKNIKFRSICNKILKCLKCKIPTK